MDLVERDELVRTTVAATLRLVAEWGLAFDALSDKSARQELHDIADQVERLAGDEMPCPVCEEITCDDGCPLAGVRRGA